MPSIRTFVRRRRFSTFVALAFLLTWSPWLLVVAGGRAGRPDPPTVLLTLGGFGPLLAAALVATAAGDLVPWVRNLVDVGASTRVWAAAVVLPVALQGLAAGIAVVGGGTFDPAAVPPPPAILAIVVASFVQGGLEEPGWRGMALPVLQRRTGALLASVAIGVIWAAWHLPLFLMPGRSQSGTSLVLFALTVVGLSVVATALYNAAGGRVVVPIVFHTLWNAASASIAVGVGGGRPGTQVGALLVVWATSAVLVYRYGTERLSSRPLPGGGLDFQARAC